MNQAFITLLSGIILFIGTINLKAQELNNQPTPVIEVKSLTGKIWMDRNLGATQKATSSRDAASYGYLYQWGRLSDGHQKRSSPTTKKLSLTTSPPNNQFVKATKFPSDWIKTQNSNVWQGVTGINNPCPIGFRLPTVVEFDEEIATWKTKNANGAISSALKLPLTGYRSNGDGKVIDSGFSGDYWTSTIDNNNSKGLYFDESSAGTDAGGRGVGVAVRCIKN